MKRILTIDPLAAGQQQRKQRPRSSHARWEPRKAGRDALEILHRDYAELCGELLARGHARSGDPATLAEYIGRGPRFDKAVASFARGYADQTEQAGNSC